jgi:hypothetical protein
MMEVNLKITESTLKKGNGLLSWRANNMSKGMGGKWGRGSARMSYTWGLRGNTTSLVSSGAQVLGGEKNHFADCHHYWVHKMNSLFELVPSTLMNT